MSFVVKIYRRIIKYLLSFVKWITDFFKISNKIPVIILGHQKSGTTAVAKLLGAAVAKTVCIDPFYLTKEKQIQLPPVYEDKSLLKKYIKNNAFLYSQDIIKDPEFVFFYTELKQIYPNSKFIFIIRNPFDNIKSIFDRLKIPGDINYFDENMYPEVTNTWDWKMILNGELTGIKGKNIVETLSLRWLYSVNLYLKHQDELILVKYEDFKKEKLNVIITLANKIGFDIKKEISHVLDKQYQRKGTNTNRSAEEFFSKENYETVEKLCGAVYRQVHLL